jgi:hypothetical protein
MMIPTGRRFKNTSLALLAILSLQSKSSAADTNAPASPPDCCAADFTSPKWSIELGSGAIFSNVRDSSLDSYTIVPIRLTLSYAFDPVNATNFAGGWFDGYPEAVVDGYYDRVTSGVESYIAGFHFGGRYNFTHLQGPVTPFFELLVGAGWADAHQFYSNGNYHGLGENFNFNFSGAIGARYDITKQLFTRLSVEYTHYSNAGLSEPQHSNKAIDALGPILSLGIRF